MLQLCFRIQGEKKRINCVKSVFVLSRFLFLKEKEIERKVKVRYANTIFERKRKRLEKKRRKEKREIQF